MVEGNTVNEGLGAAPVEKNLPIVLAALMTPVARHEMPGAFHCRGVAPDSDSLALELSIRTAAPTTSFTGHPRLQGLGGVAYRTSGNDDVRRSLASRTPGIEGPDRETDDAAHLCWSEPGVTVTNAFSHTIFEVCAHLVVLVWASARSLAHLGDVRSAHANACEGGRT
jgi:hypothetical protein